MSAERDGGWRKSLAWKLLIWAVFIVPFAIYLRRRQQPNEKEGKKSNWKEKMTIKKIVQFETAVKRREGGGFMVRRPVGDKIDMVDPFLMLDHLGPTVYGPGEAIGAPDHPHRGFETVTYIIDGKYNLALKSIYKFMSAQQSDYSCLSIKRLTYENADVIFHKKNEQTPTPPRELKIFF